MIDDRHPMDFGPLEDVAYLSVLVLLVTAVQYTVYGPHGDLVYWLWGGMGVVGLLLVARLRVVFRGVEEGVAFQYCVVTTVLMERDTLAPLACFLLLSLHWLGHDYY